MQCEVCHGPGSKHVAEEGLEEPLAIRKETPASTCTVCHNEQHSDTFQYEAYLRDILGPGHGPSARKKLGDGPTGHELRTAALARAKTAGKAQAKNCGRPRDGAERTSSLGHPRPLPAWPDADGGAGQQLVQQVGLDVAAGDDDDRAPAADPAGVVEQRGDAPAPPTPRT